MPKLTLDLTDEEIAVIEQLSAQHGVSDTAIMRQALRLYQTANHRIAQGETMSFSGDKERAMAFVGGDLPFMAGP